MVSLEVAVECSWALVTGAQTLVSISVGRAGMHNIIYISREMECNLYICRGTFV